MSEQRRLCVAAATAAAAVLLAVVPTTQSAAAAAARPSVTRLSTTSGPIRGGTPVTITGRGFSHVRTVWFGSTAGSTVSVLSSTTVRVTAPGHAAGTVQVTITTSAGASAAVTADRFTYIAPPAVSTVTPSAGPAAGGTAVTITGGNFQNVTAVAFGASRATSVKTLSPAKITAVAPKGAAGHVDVRVTTAYGTSAAVTADRYSYVAPPTVNGLSPASGPIAGGTLVTVIGSNLSGASRVLFGTTAGTAVSVTSAYRLTVRAPAHAAGSADLRVATAGGTSAAAAADRYTYVVPPAVTSAVVEEVTTASATLSWVNPPVSAFRGVTIRRSAGTTAPATVTSGTAAVTTSGTVDLWTDNTVTPGQTYSYALFADDGDQLGYAAPARITVAVPTRPELTGTIRDSTATPVQGATVRVLGPDGREAAHATTAADGTYSVAGLPAGNYTVCFDPDAVTTATAGNGLLPRCWRDTDPGAPPNPIWLSTDGTFTGVDQTLQSAASLSGTVIAAGGTPLPDVTVTVGDADGEPVAQTTTGSPGTWTVVGLPAGTYTVCFDPATAAGTTAYAPACYNQVGPTATPTPVTVTTNTATHGIDATLTTTAPAPARTKRSTATTDEPTTGEVRSEDLAQLPCQDVLFLAARGSGESGPGGAKDLHPDPNQGVGGPVHSAYQTFASHLSDGKTITAPVSVSYPADNVSVLLTHALSHAYITDLDSGVTEARRALTSRATQCPNERIVLAGYSQGAMIMHRVLNNTTLAGTPALPAAVRARIDASILIGDGDRVAQDTTHNYGTAKVAGQGIGIQTPGTGTSPAKLPTVTGAGTYSVCTAGDIVCDFHVPYLCPACALYHGIDVHLSYTNSPAVKDAATDAAAWEETIPAVGGPALAIRGNAGITLHQQLTATVNTGDIRNLAWALAPGAYLPTGLTLAPGGLITGTPAVAATQNLDLVLTATTTLGVTESPLTVHAIVTIGPPGPGVYWTPANVANAGGSPQDISCGSAGLCAQPGVALGGGTWSDTTDWAHISCGQDGICAADDGSLWTGHGWSGSALPNPSDYDPRGRFVDGPHVVCGSSCLAAGSYYVTDQSGHTVDRAALWTLTGETWTLSLPPDLPGQDPNGPTGTDQVACATNGTCVADGFVTVDGNRAQALWTETNGHWSASRYLWPADADGQPTTGEGGVEDLNCGVDVCAAATSTYTRVGHVTTYTSTNLLTLQNGTWTSQPVPTTQAGFRLRCGAAGTCLGFQDALPQGSDTAVWQLTNGTWTQISLPTPETGATGHYIEGAACGPDGVCVAYGYVHGGTALWTLSNGVWTATLVPPPTGSTQADVWDVSCGTGGVCVLTGGYDTSATTSAGAVWVTRGGAWSVQPVPVPASAPAGTTTSAWWAACGWGPGAVCAVNGAAGTATLWTLTLDP